MHIRRRMRKWTNTMWTTGGATLKKSFKWMANCQQAFEDLKAYLSSPPLLSPSKPGEELFLYLVVSSTVVSAALVREEDRV